MGPYLTSTCYLIKEDDGFGENQHYSENNTNKNEDILITKLYFREDLSLAQLSLLETMSSEHINNRLCQLLLSENRNSIIKFKASIAIAQRKKELMHSKDNYLMTNNPVITDFSVTSTKEIKDVDNNEALHLKENKQKSMPNPGFNSNLDIIKQKHNHLKYLGADVSIEAYSNSTTLEESTRLSKNLNGLTFDDNMMNLGFEGFKFMDPQESLDYSWLDLKIPSNYNPKELAEHPKNEESSDLYSKCLENKLSLEVTLSKFNHISCSLENELCSKLSSSSRSNLLKVKNVEEELLKKLIEVKCESPYYNFDQLCKTSELVENMKREIEIQLRLIQTSKFKIEILNHCS